MAREGGLLAWQWRHYPEGHQDRRNLALHMLSWPLFISGTLALVTSPLTGWWQAPVGLILMALTVALQGRGHSLEQVPPIPFLGPGEFVARFFLEQWVNFPRFVLTGGWSDAWRSSGVGPRP